MLRYAPPKPAPLPADFDEFYASLTPEEKDLHALAIEMLQSSYFVQWSHMYKKWRLPSGAPTPPTQANTVVSDPKKIEVPAH